MPLAPADRLLLGEAGLPLDEDTYVRAVAAAGATAVAWNSRAWGRQACVRWTPAAFRRRTRAGRQPAGTAALRHLARAWPPSAADPRRGAPSRGRLLLHAPRLHPGDPDLVAVARVLGHPATGFEAALVQLEAPGADLKWQWPPRVAALPGEAGEVDIGRLLALSPAGGLVETAPPTREHARCEILLAAGSLRRALRQVLSLPHPVRAGHLVVFGPLDLPWTALRALVDALLAETQAGGLSLVAAQTKDAPGLVNALVRELARNVPYDLAVARALPRDASLHVVDLRLVDAAALTAVAARLGRRLDRLPPEVAVDVREATARRVGWAEVPGRAEIARTLTKQAGDLPFARASEGAAALGEIAAAERGARRAAAAVEAPRLLQGRLLAGSRGAWRPETRGMVAGRDHALDVFIGPREADTLGEVAVPEAGLDWAGRDLIRLQVLLVEPGQWEAPIAGTLDLPRTGRSATCRLVFVPVRAGRFRGRVIVYHRGRVLQTATLRARVVAAESALPAPGSRGAPRIAPEANLRRSLATVDDRRRFDACLLAETDPRGAPTLTAAAGQGAYLASLARLGPQLAEINGVLNQVALDAAPYQGGLLTPPNATLLGDLARRGTVLYRHLVLDHIDRSTAARALRASEYLQIVSTDPDALVPFEFVYEYPPPGSGVPVCPNAIDALKAGRCPASCVPQRSPADRVCPLGFWGLSRVIERHLHVPDLPHPAMVLAEPVGGRDELPLTGPSLLAASRQVSAASRDELLRAMRDVWGGRVATVGTWAAWQQAVASSSPALLLAMPHAEGHGADISLEIDGDVLQGIFIDRSYVRGSAPEPPVVVLLGCDTANVADADAYTRHIGIFRQAQAALVLGTIATVLAADAARVATQLVRRLGEALERAPDRFGEVLRQVKRDAVAGSLMTALCVVAFGDADWRLRWR
jgi:hypothetical protein